MSEVLLHGEWASPFSYRVIWALRLKGIKFECIEEDLSNKSPLLLHYNPIYNKIPVLVHEGKPICESTIILEYIEETWPQNPLLPRSDSLERATARFWIKFAEEKGPTIWKIFVTRGEEQDKVKNESLEILRTIEEKEPGEKKFFGGENIGLLDLSFGWMPYWLGVIEEILGLKLLDADKFPRLHAWIKNFKQVPIIKDNLLDRDRMLIHFSSLREKLLR